MSAQHITLDPTFKKPPTKDAHSYTQSNLPPPTETRLHPKVPGGENAAIRFIGNATTILEWEGIRLMTDPNFLHAGDHVHLGPGVNAKRVKDPSVDLHDLPNIDVVLLSHYHEDHFDRLVEDNLRRDLPIISTPHALECLTTKKPSDPFTAVSAVDCFQSLFLDIPPSPTPSTSNLPRHAAIKVTAMPGKHVPPGILNTVNDILGAVPPVNGWMLELGYYGHEGTSNDVATTDGAFESKYRIYISGDTLMIDELKEIPARYTQQGKNIDLMLVHLGGTSIPGANMPLLMVTMDAVQGLQLVKLVKPDLVLPVHFDDYNVFKSPLEDFKNAVREAGLEGKVVWWDRGEEYKFKV